MYALGKKPVLILGTTAMIALGATGISAQAHSTASKNSTGVSATTPGGKGGKGRGLDTAALATKLGVSQSALTTALEAARSELGTPDRAADMKAEAQAIADALGVDVSTITAVFEAQRPAGAKPKGSASFADAVRPTTPPAGGKGGHGKGHRGNGGPNQTALIAAIVKATGKTETQVKTALAAGRTAHEKAHASQDAKFAQGLASKLGLETSAVQAALDAVRPARPSAPATTTAATS